MSTSMTPGVVAGAKKVLTPNASSYRLFHHHTLTVVIGQNHSSFKLFDFFRVLCSKEFNVQCLVKDSFRYGRNTPH